MENEAGKSKNELNKGNNNEIENHLERNEASINNNKHKEIIINEGELMILNQKIAKIKNNNIYILFFITEFGLIFILGIIVLFLYIIPEYHSVKIFTSKKANTPFDPNYIPKIFIHTTDIHITLNRPHRLDGSSIFLSSLYEYNPDFFILTGDYVDNFKKNSRLGTQNMEDWKIYNTAIRKKMSNFPIIDISGNHDLWGVSSATSESNNFLKNSNMFSISNVKNDDDFFLKKVRMFGLTFLLLNDYRFPVIRPPYGTESHITKKQLDILENMIDNLEEEDCIILSHFPVDNAILTKSSKGNYFEDIISKKKVGYIFTGHHHPKTVKLVHHGSEGGLEFCTSSAFDKKRAGLITIDNDNLIYHEVYIPYYGSKPLFFIIYPVPNEQVSSHHIFNLNNFEIRVISYVQDNNIILKIEGDIKGNLNYIRTLTNGAHLYSYPVNLPNGSYKIHIYDESGYSCDIKTEFTIGSKFKGKSEKYIIRIRFLLGIRFLLIPFWLILFIIVFPFFPELNLNIVKNMENYIGGNVDIKIKKGLFYLYLFVLSPFFLRLRFQQISKILKYSIFISFLYPLVLPIHFISQFDGKIGYIFFIFYVIGNNKVSYEHWALQMTFMFYATIILPFILFASGKNYYKKYSKNILIINSIITIIVFITGLIINFLTIGQSLDLVFLFFTTAFIIILLINSVLFIKFYKIFNI